MSQSRCADSGRVGCNKRCIIVRMPRAKNSKRQRKRIHLFRKQLFYNLQIIKLTHLQILNTTSAEGGQAQLFGRIVLFNFQIYIRQRRTITTKLLLYKNQVVYSISTSIQSPCLLCFNLRLYVRLLFSTRCGGTGPCVSRVFCFKY